MPTENKIDCPALHKRSASYPYGDRVPRTVRMLVTATADRIPGVELSHYPEATAGKSYRVWTNSHGAVVAVMDDGNRLGLRPAEFEVDSWHHLASEPARPPEPIAWMVGTAFWWTKEEAERDAAATGKPLVPFGPIADTGEIERLRTALKFYADREHYHFESGDWDTVSGEPLNILWHGEEPDFIEDGSVARAALEHQS